MSETIKAIETEYNGYRFRSRLEARWAVFFDAVGIKYQYEPDGFEYDGEKYLPDFYLPDFEMYVEVKPDDPNRYHEIEKAVEVCCQATNKILLLLGDIPNITNCGWWVYNAFYNNPMDGVLWRPVILRIAEIIEENGNEITEGWFVKNDAIVRDVETTAYKFCNELNHRVHFPVSGMSLADFELPKTQMDKYRVLDMETKEDFEFAKQAYKKARQARFEHGEKPSV